MQFLLYGARQIGGSACTGGAQGHGGSSQRSLQRGRALGMPGDVLAGRRQTVEPALTVVDMRQGSRFGPTVLASHGTDGCQSILHRKQLARVHRVALRLAERVGYVLHFVQCGLHLFRELLEASIDGGKLADRVQRGTQHRAGAPLRLRRGGLGCGQQPLDLLSAAKHTLPIQQLLLFAVAEPRPADLGSRMLQKLAITRGAVQIASQSIQVLLELGETARVRGDGHHLFLHVGVPVQEPALLGRRQQRLMLVLSVDRQQHASELGVVGQWNRYRLYERRSPAPPASHAPHEQRLAGEGDRARVQPPVDLLRLRCIEHRGHLADFRA